MWVEIGIKEYITETIIDQRIIKIQNSDLDGMDEDEISAFIVNRIKERNMIPKNGYPYWEIVDNEKGNINVK